MNRQIKFRVWDTVLNIWINNIGMGKNNVLTHGTEKRFHVMQFTGLKDRSGKDVYEGDICRYEIWFATSADPERLGRTEKGKAVIRFEHGCFLCGNIPLHYSDLTMEVIGNIHENPELLKV